MKKPNAVLEYIESFPKDTQRRMKQIRACIKAAAPDAKEDLKWSMPSYSYRRILVMFAGFKNHIGFYPTPSAIKAFAKDLKDFKTSKGAIQFPHDKPLPIALVKKITRYRVKESIFEDKKWRQK